MYTHIYGTHIYVYTHIYGTITNEKRRHGFGEKGKEV